MPKIEVLGQTYQTGQLGQTDKHQNGHRLLGPSENGKIALIKKKRRGYSDSDIIGIEPAVWVQVVSTMSTRSWNLGSGATRTQTAGSIP